MIYIIVSILVLSIVTKAIYTHMGCAKPAPKEGGTQEKQECNDSQKPVSVAPVDSPTESERFDKGLKKVTFIAIKFCEIVRTISQMIAALFAFANGLHRFMQAYYGIADTTHNRLYTGEYYGGGYGYNNYGGGRQYYHSGYTNGGYYNSGYQGGGYQAQNAGQYRYSQFNNGQQYSYSQFNYGARNMY